MPRKGHSPEQILNKLRQVEVAVANGKQVAQAVRDIGVSDHRYYKWRAEYGGLNLDQARKLKQLERENARLKTVAKKILKLRGTEHQYVVQSTNIIDMDNAPNPEE